MPGASSRVNFSAAIRVIAPPNSPHTNSSHTAAQQQEEKAGGSQIRVKHFDERPRQVEPDRDWGAESSPEPADSNSSPTERVRGEIGGIRAEGFAQN